MSGRGHAPVDFDMATLALGLSDLKGEHNVLASQMTQNIQTLNGTLQAMQADVQRIGERNADNNTLLHALTERSSGLERIATAVERAGGDHAEEVRKVALEMAGMKGFIRGVVLCGALGFGSLAAFVVYRMDNTDVALSELRDMVRMYHPAAGVTR